MSKPDQRFESFYFTKVGLGEGCGCAEKVIDVHEFNRLAGKPSLRKPRLTLPTRAGLRRFLQRAGLTTRPRTPNG